MCVCVCVVSPPRVPRTCLVQGVEKMLNVPTAAAALSAGCSLVTKQEARVPVLKHLPWRALTVKGSVLQEGLCWGGAVPTGQMLQCTILAALPTASHLPTPSSNV